jgi:hypothetical protein
MTEIEDRAVHVGQLTQLRGGSQVELAGEDEAAGT